MLAVRPAVGAVLTVPSATLFLTECGGPNEPVPAASAKASPEEIAYYHCPESNGVVPQTPNPGQLRVDKNTDPAVEAEASKKCAQEQAAIPEVALSEEELAAARAKSECVREKGSKNFPDPAPKTGEVDPAAAGVPGNPELREAVRECAGVPGGPEDGAIVGG